MEENLVLVSDGICTGRNGTYELSAIEISTFHNSIRLDGVSKIKKQVLNAGFSMDRNAAKNLAKSILKTLEETKETGEKI